MPPKSNVFPAEEILETKTTPFNNVKPSAQNKTSAIPVFTHAKSTPVSINTTIPHKDALS